jgi:hypothetical protein
MAFQRPDHAGTKSSFSHVLDALTADLTDPALKNQVRHSSGQ